ncbi:MAG: AI-2E family transporter [Elusimicrobia bacterium]|nr:AI-2E family transporter [Candidatus Liberimonas magnetica]
MLERKIFKVAFLILAACFVLWFIYFIRDMLMPFILSALFTYILSPYITKLQAMGLKRSISVCILYTLFLFVFVGSLILFLPKIINEVTVLNNNLPQQFEKFQVVMKGLQDNLEQKYPILKDKAVIETGIQKANEFLLSQVKEAPTIIMNLFSVFSLLVLIPILIFFMLLSGNVIMQRIFNAIPSEFTETSLGLIFEIDEILGQFIRSQILESIFVGILSIAGYFILGIDYALILGIVSGLSNFIPYVGPAIAILPVLIIGFMKFGTMSIIINILILFTIIRFLDDNVIKTILMKRTVNVGPILMIFSVMAGAELYGMVGMLLAVPVAAIIKTVVSVLMGKHPITRDIG